MEYTNNTTLPTYTEVNGITEEMKAASPMKWTATMNGIAQAVREIVGNELIYT